MLSFAAGALTVVVLVVLSVFAFSLHVRKAKAEVSMVLTLNDWNAGFSRWRSESHWTINLGYFQLQFYIPSIETRREMDWLSASDIADVLAEEMFVEGYDDGYKSGYGQGKLRREEWDTLPQFVHGDPFNNDEVDWV
jgi:hypothetical protein